MFKKIVLAVVATLLFVFQFNVSGAAAIDIPEEARTVKATPDGQTVVLSLKEVEKGQRIFNGTCSSCHNSGRSKNNPNVTLGLQDLAGAFPARDNIASMVDYLKKPTSYDGEISLAELHPNTQRSDLYPTMRNFSDEDLENVSGYILTQGNVRGILWGSGKVYN
jgi:photosystem II cytochrome c550